MRLAVFAILLALTACATTPKGGAKKVKKVKVKPQGSWLFPSYVADRSPLVKGLYLAGPGH